MPEHSAISGKACQIIRQEKNRFGPIPYSPDMLFLVYLWGEEGGELELFEEEAEEEGAEEEDDREEEDVRYVLARRSLQLTVKSETETLNNFCPSRFSQVCVSRIVFFFFFQNANL